MPNRRRQKTRSARSKKPPAVRARSRPRARGGAGSAPPGLADLVSTSERTALYRPTGKALGLPGRVYGPEFYELERKALFPRRWCFVAAASEMPRPGDVLPVLLAEHPLLLVRGADGEVRAFYNICRHRGMRLVIEKVGRKSELRCPWHGWTYGLDGRLAATPGLGGVGTADDPEFSCRDIALAPVRCGLWHDAIAVNLDGRAPPLASEFRPFDRTLVADGYDLDAFRHLATWETSYAGNWKVSVEGGIEEYHLPWGHPQFVATVAHQELKPLLGRNYAGHRVVNRHRNESGGAGPPHASLPVLPGFANGRDRYYIVSLFPTAIVALLADHYVFALFMPDGWNRTRIVFHIYVVGEAAQDPAHAEARKTLYDAWAAVGGQDRDFVKYVHANAGVRETAGVRTRFTPFWEQAVQHFQKLVIETIGKGARA